MTTKCSDRNCFLLACDSRILSAVRDELSARGPAGEEFCVHHAANFADACSKLNEVAHFKVVAVELSFDVDRMFDLLNVLSDFGPPERVICFRGYPPRIAVSSDRAIATVARLIANAEFRDLSHLLVKDAAGDTTSQVAEYLRFREQ